MPRPLSTSRSRRAAQRPSLCTMPQVDRRVCTYFISVAGRAGSLLRNIACWALEPFPLPLNAVGTS